MTVSKAQAEALLKRAEVAQKNAAAIGQPSVEGLYPWPVMLSAEDAHAFATAYLEALALLEEVRQVEGSAGNASLLAASILHKHIREFLGP